MSADVLILGAGVAGLSAALDLVHAGLQVEILEARDRVGGRIFTREDPVLKHAIEFGAEFIHGLAPEIWVPLQQHKLAVSEVEGDLWCSTDGKLQKCNFFEQADKILRAMEDGGPDESFLDFISRRFPGHEHEPAKQWATGYVSGFNAADPGLVSVHWLAHSRAADEQIEGDRAFRIAGGYRRLVDIFLSELTASQVEIHLNTIVRSITWGPGSVEIGAETARGKTKFSAPRVLITLPLGVLQAAPDLVRFMPELPQEKQTALNRLATGRVVRVTLRFREPFWQALRGTPCTQSLADLSFLFSRDDFFPTWWTQMPAPVPVITGWAPAHSAERLAGMNRAGMNDDEAIIGKALDSLSSLLSLEKFQIEAELCAAYFHDWDSDRFSRGAYSYVKAGGEGCQQTLGSPVSNTLFFAGEATDTTGHNGTVHGAIASGNRAAQDILNLQ